MAISIQRLSDHVKLPERGSKGAAGLDLYAHLPDGRAILPVRGRLLVPTGLIVAIPTGYVGLIWARSGWSLKHGIGILAGVIDCDYRGELMVLLINHGDQPVTISHHDRVAQLVIVPYCCYGISDVTAIPNLMTQTERGAGGFGSTGGTPDPAKQASEGDQYIGMTTEELKQKLKRSEYSDGVKGGPVIDGLDERK